MIKLRERKFRGRVKVEYQRTRLGIEIWPNRYRIVINQNSNNRKNKVKIKINKNK